jgi:hypothetical protein
MEEKHDDEDRDVPLHGQLAADHVCARKDERHRHSFTQSPVDGHLRVVARPGPFSFQIPGIDLPGIFFESYVPALPVINVIDEITTDDETCIEQFHGGESESIYDLFNACDGAVHDGFLDIRKLEQLSVEELEVLDIERLREIWRHTISGCLTCSRIVRTLNSVRHALSDDDSFPVSEPIFSVDSKPH